MPIAEPSAPACPSPGWRRATVKQEALTLMSRGLRSVRLVTVSGIGTVREPTIATRRTCSLASLARARSGSWSTCRRRR